MTRGLEPPLQGYARPSHRDAREGRQGIVVRPSHPSAREFERLAAFSLHLARFRERAGSIAGLGGQTAPLPKLLRSIFGRGWTHLAADALNRSEAQIEAWSRRSSALPRREMARLLEIIASRRSEMKNDWREARIAAGRLVFEWAREGQLTHLDAEMRRRLDQLSAAETWIGDAMSKARGRGSRRVSE
jgi:hypothetical protein